MSRSRLIRVKPALSVSCAHFFITGFVARPHALSRPRPRASPARSRELIRHAQHVRAAAISSSAPSPGRRDKSARPEDGSSRSCPLTSPLPAGTLPRMLSKLGCRDQSGRRAGRLERKQPLSRTTTKKGRSVISGPLGRAKPVINAGFAPARVGGSPVSPSRRVRAAYGGCRHRQTCVASCRTRSIAWVMLRDHALMYLCMRVRRACAPSALMCAHTRAECKPLTRRDGLNRCQSAREARSLPRASSFGATWPQAPTVHVGGHPLDLGRTCR